MATPKQGKAPAFQFYPGDWLKDPALGACEPHSRGIWMDAMCAMYESRSGRLTGTAKQLARVCRCSPDEMLDAARELLENGAADAHTTECQWVEGGQCDCGQAVPMADTAERFVLVSRRIDKLFADREAERQKKRNQRGAKGTRTTAPNGSGPTGARRRPVDNSTRPPECPADGPGAVPAMSPAHSAGHSASENKHLDHGEPGCPENVPADVPPPVPPLTRASSSTSSSISSSSSSCTKDPASAKTPPAAAADSKPEPEPKKRRWRDADIPADFRAWQSWLVDDRGWEVRRVMTASVGTMARDWCEQGVSIGEANIAADAAHSRQAQPSSPAYYRPFVADVVGRRGQGAMPSNGPAAPPSEAQVARLHRRAGELGIEVPDGIPAAELLDLVSTAEGEVVAAARRDNEAAGLRKLLEQAQRLGHDDSAAKLQAQIDQLQGGRS